jgi:methyl-accepting chemotaxis protein
MLHNLRIHQRFVAILPLPLVLLAALAAGRIRSNVTEGVRAGRVNTLVIFTITLAGLARVRQRLAGLDAHRQAIDARRFGLADSLGWYSDTIETLIRVEDVADEVDNRGVAGVLAAEADGRPPSIELTTWFFATSAALDLLRKVEVELATATDAASQASAAAADRRAATDAVGIVALALILGLSLVTAGSMARPLRQLERAALEVAERRLPGMTERLQRGEVDEIGQVARAFNEAHRVAARVATEQAALRKSIGDLFHNLARRSQGLVDRQLVPLIADNSSALISAAHLADNR